jgi:hypothetical protein
MHCKGTDTVMMNTIWHEPETVRRFFWLPVMVVLLVCALVIATPSISTYGGPCAGEEVLAMEFGPNWENDYDYIFNTSSRSNTDVSSVNIGGDQCLRVVYPAGKTGIGLKFRVALPPSDHYILSYDVMFGDGFDFVLGGKMPGLFGGVGQTGGNVIRDGSGFSSRTMWKKNGFMQTYVYHAEQSRKWGDPISTDSPVLIPGQMHHVTMETIMNTPGVADGIVRIWVDGRLVIEGTDYLFRYDNSLHIDKTGISTFFGGNTKEWAAKKDEEAFFCNYKVMAGDTAQCTATDLSSSYGSAGYVSPDERLMVQSVYEAAIKDINNMRIASNMIAANNYDGRAGVADMRSIRRRPGRSR